MDGQMGGQKLAFLSIYEYTKSHKKRQKATKTGLKHPIIPQLKRNNQT